MLPATSTPAVQETVKAVVGVLKQFSRYDGVEPLDEPQILRETCLDLIKTFVSEGRPVVLILPAFPWKNKNTDKVIGSHPDLGEELALARLNHLCEEIKKVYIHGAKLHLVADGPVYNDYLGIADEEYYEYGVQLRNLAAEKSFTNIKFLRLTDLLHGSTNVDVSKQDYLYSFPRCESILKREFLEAGFDVDDHIQRDEDTRTTYRGYVRLIEEDFQGIPRCDGSSSEKGGHDAPAEELAKQLTRRLLAYENLLHDRYGSAIRLSIHPSSGKTKLTIPLLPHDTHSRGTPWHTSVAILASGKVKVGYSKDFREEYEIIEKGGKQWYFREKSSLFALEGPVEIDYDYEGIILRNKSSEPFELSTSDKEKIGKLGVVFKSIRYMR